MKKIVVIGSGLAGSLICNALAGKCEVTLLEMGEKNRIQYPPVTYINKHFGAVKTFCIAAGGTTNLWDNGLIPINPEDVTIPHFNRMLHEASPFMDRAAAGLHFDAGSYSSEYSAARLRMTQVAEKIGTLSDGVDCLIYPKKFKALTLDPPVQAVYGASDIAFAVRAGRADTVTFTARGERHSLHPDIVVVSAGALGTPGLAAKLLSAAGRSPDRCGIGLADHPMGFIGKIKIKEPYRSAIRQMAYDDRGAYRCRTLVRVKSDCGRYTAGLFFRPALTMQNELAIYKYKSLLGASKGKERIRNALSAKLLHPDILAEIYSHLTGFQIKGRIYNLLVLFEQKRGAGKVSWDNGAIRVDWAVTNQEMALYNQMLNKLKNMLLPIADELALRIPVTEDWLWSSAHHSGTIAQGAKPVGLVDETLRLNDLENVYICDGSVIQEHSYANTGLTIGQLAIGLAHRLARGGHRIQPSGKAALIAADTA